MPPLSEKSHTAAHTGTTFSSAHLSFLTAAYSLICGANFGLVNTASFNKNDTHKGHVGVISFLLKLGEILILYAMILKFICDNIKLNA